MESMVSNKVCGDFCRTKISSDMIGFIHLNLLRLWCKWLHISPRTYTFYNMLLYLSYRFLFWSFSSHWVNVSTPTALKKSNSLQNIHVFHVMSVVSAFMCFRKIAENDYQLRHSCPSVRPHGTFRFPLDGFSWSLISLYFCKVFREKAGLIKIWGNNWDFGWIPIYIFDHISPLSS